MSRPVEFDRATAVAAALKLFWARGYQATSLTDLVSTMGISRSSFYSAFGDKSGLFLECLDRFAERSIGLLSRARTDHPPVEALRSFFSHSLNQPDDGQGAWGCLLINSVMELAEVDEALWSRARLRLAEVEAAFEACLADTGCGPQKAAELASFLMLLNEGIRVSARRNLPLNAQHLQIETTFQLLATALAA